MNILIVNSVFTGGGAEKIARQLYYGLSINYNINTFFIAGRASKSEKEIIEIYDYDKTWIRLFNSSRNLISNNARRRDSFSRNIILSCIKEYNINIVHFHNIHGNYIGIEDIGEISKHCKVVWTLHDMWALTGHCAYSLECNNWTDNCCKKCPQLRLYPQMFIDRASNIYRIKKSGFVDKNIEYVVPSKWLMDQCNKTFLAKERKTLIYNGVNFIEFYPIDKTFLRKKYNVSETKIVLMFAANSIHSPYKGAEVLEKALKLISRKEKYELVIVGKCDQASFSDYFKCHYMGYVDSDKKMNELYNLADVFIVPSYAENFPCSILESMAVGTPVIASKAGGIVEQIDENTGWLFDTGDAKQLAQIIDEISLKCKELANMGVLCRKKVKEQFSEEKMLQEYQQLYTKICMNSIE